MPPKAPPPAASKDKGKGKEEATPATSSSTTTSTTSTAAATAPQRRQPVGKVIHYFADNQSQGYDGLAFQEAYKTHVIQRIQEHTDVAREKAANETLVDVAEEDLKTLMALTGLKKESARECFQLANSSKPEDACKAYLHPEQYDKSNKTTSAVMGLAKEAPSIAAA